MLLNASYINILNTAIADVTPVLKTFSGDSLFAEKFTLAFGTTVSSEQFLQTVAALPQIEVRSDAELEGALGAFSAQTQKIYLSESLVQGNQSQLQAVLIEEIGHYLDAQVNATDTPGDEGELFSAVVRGVRLSPSELSRIKTEDDHAVVMIGGQMITVEKNSLNTPNPTYEWDINFISSINSSPILDWVNTIGNDATDTVIGQNNKSVYKFSGNSGLLLSNPTISSENYSVELVFVLSTNSGYRKIIDFSDRVSDTGLYVHNNSLEFYDQTQQGGTLLPGYNHVVLSRSIDNITTIYLNGSQVLSFNDINGLADLSSGGNLYLFVDDNALDSGAEYSAGAVDFIGLYNSPLSAVEVLTRYNIFRGGVTLAISPTSVTEGNSGTKNATFNVTRTGTVTNTITVNYSTADGTATAGSDYIATSGTLTFLPNETAKIITVPILSDTTIESDETIQLIFTDPTNGATIGTENTATLTIIDNDSSSIAFSSSNYSVNENGTPINAVTITRTGNLTSAVSVTVTPTNGTATTADYTNTPITVNFAATA